MPYVVNQAANALTIAERQWFTAGQIRFTGFSSCVGLVVLQGGQLTAVHLAQQATDSSWFDTVAAGVVLGLLPIGYTKSIVMGQISTWAFPTGHCVAGYQHLTGLLTNLTAYQFAEGTYGADIAGTDIEITY